MTCSEVAVIAFATLAGPIAAVQIQKWLEDWRNQRSRRINLFKTLMSTRAAVLSPAHVQSLNSIELEFQDEKFRPIVSAWRTYHDHLNNFPKGEPAPDPAAVKVWEGKSPDLLSALLIAMSQALGYKFDDVDIKRGAYTPIAHSRDENEARALRFFLLNTFSGSTALKMEVTKFPSDPEAIEHYKKALINLGKALDGGKLSVEITT